MSVQLPEADRPSVDEPAPARPETDRPGTVDPTAARPEAERPDVDDGVDGRLTTLELKVMDVERTVEALDAVILRQARDIEGLRAERERLEARLESLAEGMAEAPSPDDERPPHY